MKTPELTFQSNFLRVNGRFMKLEQYTAQDFGALIRLGHQALVAEMNAIHIRTSEQNPMSYVQRPSIGVMDVGPHTLTWPVLSDIGYIHGTGWYQDPAQVSERVRPYWDAILDSHFIPEIRLLGSSRNSRTDTHGLFLRDTPYEP